MLHLTQEGDWIRPAVSLGSLPMAPALTVHRLWYVNERTGDCAGATERPVEDAAIAPEARDALSLVNASTNFLMIRPILTVVLVAASSPLFAQPQSSLYMAARTAGASDASASSLVAALAAPTQEAELSAADASANANFGFSVALSATRAVVGAPLDATLGAGAGAVYVFTRSGSTWTQEAKLLAPNGGANHGFGYAVSVSEYSFTGLQIAVGAPSVELAYVYELRSGVWTFRGSIGAADRVAGDSFGTSVSIDFGRLLVGAPGKDVTETDSGAAYLFTRPTGPNSSLQQRHRLVGSERAAGDRLGSSVSLAGTTAAVGAPGDDDPLADSGALYFFEGLDTDFLLRGRRIRVPQMAAGDALGASVALQLLTADDVRVVAGATGRDGTAPNAGSALVAEFRVGSATTTSVTEIADASGRADDAFGSTVAVQGSLIAVGTNRGAAATATGVACLFESSAGTWQQAASVRSSDETPGDRFGLGVALGADGRLLVGANRTSDAGTRSGSAYVFTGVRPVATEAPAEGTSALALSPPVPNPATGRAVLMLRVDRPQDVRAVLVDALGREAAVLLDGAVVGEARLDVSVGTLAPGAYTVRVVGAGHTVSQRLTVLR